MEVIIIKIVIILLNIIIIIIKFLPIATQVTGAAGKGRKGCFLVQGQIKPSHGGGPLVVVGVIFD